MNILLPEVVVAAESFEAFLPSSCFLMASRDGSLRLGMMFPEVSLEGGVAPTPRLCARLELAMKFTHD